MNAASASASRFRWTIILLLFAINTVNYVDRSAIAFAAHLISAEFDLSASELGLVLGAFGIGYLITTFPGGYVADRFGARVTFLIAVVLWSLAIGWTGVATGFLMLYFARMVLGLAEGPSFPAHSRIVERWLPPHERATAVAIALVAIPVALAVGAPLVTYLITAFGWRVMFFILAAAGLAWLPAWYLLGRDFPSQSRFVNGAERDHIAEGREAQATPAGNSGLSRADWRIILTTPTLLAGYWSYFVFGYLLFFVMTWLPDFLRTTYHLDLTQIGWLASLPWAAAAVSLYLVGRWSDRLLVRTGRTRVARSYLMAGSHALIAIAVLPLLFADSLPVALACMTVAVAAGLGANPVFYAVIADIVPRAAGTCMGVMNSGLAISGFLAPALTGFALDATGSFDAAFVLIAAFAASSVIGLLIWHQPDRDLARLKKLAESPT
ncbi:MAG: MFS transporter [Pseudomonadota bacterium]